MAAYPGRCAACGAVGEVQVHHLVPRAHGGDHLPTVYLCGGCHGAVHDREFTVHHVALTVAGLAKARANGRMGGNPGLRARDPLAIKLVQDARNAAYLAGIQADMSDWLPIIQRMRPFHTWKQTTEELVASGFTRWSARSSSEMVRRVVERLVDEGLASAELLVASRTARARRE